MAERTSYTDKCLTIAPNFALCAGCVPLDLTTRRALLLHYTPKNEYFFPKGHKDAFESLEDAAVRETEEETGFACSLHAHKLPTTATELREGTEHTEPVAVQQRCRDGVRKIIFWYVGSVSEERKGALKLGEGEEFEVEWVRWEEVLGRLTFEDDREVARVALEAMRFKA